MKSPIVVHTEEDYQQVQQRAVELGAEPDSPEKEAEQAAIAEALLAWELRREEATE